MKTVYSLAKRWSLNAVFLSTMSVLVHSVCGCMLQWSECKRL